MGVVPGDQLRERARGDRGAGGREVGIQPLLELVEQHLVFGVAEFGIARDLDRVDDLRAGRLHRGKGSFDERVDSGLTAEELTCHSQSSPLEGGRLEHPRVVGSAAAGTSAPGRGVERVFAQEGGEQVSRVAHRAGHRPGGVLARRNRNHSGTRHQADRRLHADQTADRRRTDDRTVGFGADGEGREAGCRRGAGACGRTTRVAVENVGVAGLAAAAAPAARRAGGAEVGPLREIGLAEDDRAVRTQPLDQESVASRPVSGQRQRPGAGRHPIGGVDVVLQEDRNPMQGSARTARLAFAVEIARQRQGLGIGLEHGPQRRSTPSAALAPSSAAIRSR